MDASVYPHPSMMAASTAAPVLLAPNEAVQAARASSKVNPSLEWGKRRKLNGPDAKYIAGIFETTVDVDPPTRLKNPAFWKGNIRVSMYSFDLAIKGKYPSSYGLLNKETRRPVVPTGDEGDDWLEVEVMELLPIKDRVVSPDNSIRLALLKAFDIPDSTHRVKRILEEIRGTTNGTDMLNGSTNDSANDSMSVHAKTLFTGLGKLQSIAESTLTAGRDNQSRIGKLENIAEKTLAHIGDLNGIVRRHDGDIKELDGRVGTLDGLVGTLGGQVSMTVQKLKDLESQMLALGKEQRTAMAPKSLNFDCAGEAVAKVPCPTPINVKCPPCVPITPAVTTPAVTSNDSKSVTSIAKPKLTGKQRMALRRYCGNDYADMNKQLRGLVEFQAKTQSKIEVLSSALHLLPPYAGALCRGSEHDKPFLDNLRNCLQTGAPFIEDGFYSTSKALDLIAFSTKNCWFNIQGKTGRSISLYSTQKQEDEVLLLPGTKFRVLSIQEPDDMDYRTRIKMEEM
jgi:hypothetical protein